MLAPHPPLNSKQLIHIPLAFAGGNVSPQPAAYLELGAGTPLLMLHGFMGSATCWLPLMQLVRSHHRCIALDLLGFGESAKPRIRYDIAQEVAFVHQVVTTLQLDSFSILGHSFGGWVASAYALQYPDRVSGLILAAPAGIRDDSFCGRYDHLRPLLWQSPIVDWTLALTDPLARWFSQGKTWEQIRWMRRELNAQPAARSFLVDRLRPEDAIDTVETQIHRLSMPTLVITGDRDETIPLWHSQTYARTIPQARLAILENADHSLPQTQAAAMAPLIQTFLADPVAATTDQSQTFNYSASN